ncbi:MAG: hypothetical protein JXB49_21100 [Bacteroidales bacterium]|nr:hypothetical protein [Bacteroidales bacterium]
MKKIFFLFVFLNIFFSSYSQLTGKYTDPRDGRIYKIIKIGDQWIMAENLAYKPGSGNYWLYNDDTNNFSKYGYLYDWETAQNIAPEGWHLPSVEEWNELHRFLGAYKKVINEADNEYVFLKMIEGGSSGFNAILGGSYIYSLGKKRYEALGRGTCFWSSTKDYRGTIAFIMSLCKEVYFHLESGAGTIAQPKNNGYYVRLFLDDKSVKSLISVDTKDKSENNIEEFNTITIGTQVWMKENLSSTHYSNGDPIKMISDKSEWKSINNGAYCWYNNDSSFRNTYGAIYNWYVVNDPRNLCPTGWHIPSDDEWSVLIDYLGGLEVAGNKLVDAGSHWMCPDQIAENNYGFSALPGGFRDKNGVFSYIGYTGHWWSNSQDNDKSAWYYAISVHLKNMTRFNNDKSAGKSVRCLKNN